ncbi:MAG TPA: nitrogen fixation protein NifQ [Coriobacteriia bacterium]|nr:nitrogen fixation protein NifQ [Coriobacteriia bacterium]
MTDSTDISEAHAAEHQALLALLMESASPDDPDAQRIAEWIATSAMKPGHLWQGMGLSSRAEVREILEAHFAELAAGNTKDMRWKKYFYKRLCGWNGFHD